MQKINNIFRSAAGKINEALMTVPVRVKIAGIILLPVIILGVSLNYWVTTGLSDWLSYILADARVEAAMRAGERSVIFVTILSAILSILLSFLLTHILTRPLFSLHETSQKVVEGELDTRVRVWARDEIGEVAQSVNTMLDRLVASQRDLARSNRQLQAMNRISKITDRELEIHDKLYKILGVLLDVTGLTAGWVFLRDPERDRFHLASWYNIPEITQSELLQSLADGVCACQSDLVEGNGVPSPFIHECKRLSRFASWQGVSKHISVYLEADGHKFGVINLVQSTQQGSLTADDLELLGILGSQISDAVANAWLRLKLSEKEVARQALLQSLIRAQEDERAHLSRELHDGSGQTLTSLLVQLQALDKHAQNPEMHASLERMLEVVSHAIDEIRELSYRLRPPALEELGLVPALHNLASQISRDTPIEIQLLYEKKKIELPSEIETVLYRIAQEGLTNIVRHAQANHVEIEIIQTPTTVALRIDDDGSGFDPDEIARSGSSGLGLLSMRERAELVGGELDVYSTPGSGTTIEVRIPISEPVTS